MNYIILSVVIFSIGVLGVLTRRNLIVILMSVELMLSATNIAFVSFSKLNGNLDGQAIVLIVFVLAACEAAVGLGIIVSAWRLLGTVDVMKWKELKR